RMTRDRKPPPAIDTLIDKLVARLQRQFQTQPEPVVLRVAAPRNSEGKLVRLGVTVRLTNLLPKTVSPGVFAKPWSPSTSLHAGLVNYGGGLWDGGAVGNNKHSIVMRGDSFRYRWLIEKELGV